MGAKVQQRNGQKTIPFHTPEVMLQVDGANVPPIILVGGDTWFDSVGTAIEVYKKFNVHSTFLTKNIMYLYPMGALHSVLQARFPKSVGHWVVFTAKIASIDFTHTARV